MIIQNLQNVDFCVVSLKVDKREGSELAKFFSFIHLTLSFEFGPLYSGYFFLSSVAKSIFIYQHVTVFRNQ